MPKSEVFEGEFPRVTRGGPSEYDEDVRAAIVDGKDRAMKLTTEDDPDKIRRALSHAANVHNRGIKSVLRDGVIYWRITDKRVSKPREPKPADGAAKATAAAGSKGGK